MNPNGPAFATAHPVVGLLIAALLGCGPTQPNSLPALRMATTTSTRDSGLLDLLLPQFQQQHDVRVDVIAVGTGKALKLGEAGDVDVVFVHAREAEDAFMAAGHGVRREDVMYNTFELLGPANDPAQVRGLEAPAALRRIAEQELRFVSRGDDSGTHKRELKLRKVEGERPTWEDYIETGQGMGATLVIADQMLAYVLADRGTYLRFRSKIDLVPLAKQTPELENPYGIIVVRPGEAGSPKEELSNGLVDFIISPNVQRSILEYQLDGEPLFSPLRLDDEK